MKTIWLKIRHFITDHLLYHVYLSYFLPYFSPIHLTENYTIVYLAYNRTPEEGIDFCYALLGLQRNVLCVLIIAWQ